jgi:hypothetical protein
MDTVEKIKRYCESLKERRDRLLKENGDKNKEISAIASTIREIELLFGDELKYKKKCKYEEFFDLIGEPQSNREYWILTELFIFFHGGEEHCNCDNEEKKDPCDGCKYKGTIINKIKVNKCGFCSRTDLSVYKEFGCVFRFRDMYEKE